VAVGVGGTLWAEQRVRRRFHQAVDRLTPSALSQEVAAGARQVGDRIRLAIDAGRTERDRREGELRQQFGGASPDDGYRVPNLDHANHSAAHNRGRRHEQARR
jgi:hypothetical protein